MHRHALRAALIVAAYFSLSFAGLLLLDAQPAAWVEQAISLLATPAMLLIGVWVPVLRPLGWTTGEWIVMPNGVACVALIAGYAALAYGVVLCLSSLRGRAAKAPG